MIIASSHKGVVHPKAIIQFPSAGSFEFTQYQCPDPALLLAAGVTFFVLKIGSSHNLTRNRANGYLTDNMAKTPALRYKDTDSRPMEGRTIDRGTGYS